MQITCRSLQRPTVLNKPAAAARQVSRRPWRSSQLCRADPQRGSSASGNDDDDGILTKEEIQKLAALRRERAAAAENKSSNIIIEAFEEAKLVEWPKPREALADTALVLGIVAALSVLLFVVNTGLNELSNLFYKL